MKNLAIVVLVLIVVVIAGVAIYQFRPSAAPTSTVEAPTTTVPVATQPQGWTLYPGTGFSVQYPPSWSVQENYAYDALGPGKSIPGVAFVVPVSLTQGTNLSTDTKMSVEKLPSGACQASSFIDAAQETSTATENGRTWSVAHGGGAGAGNLYDETVYATQAGTTCYGLRLFIHSSNIGNYDPGTVSEFDRPALDDAFAQFRATFAPAS